MKRILDIVFSTLAIIFFSPLLLLISFLIVIDSKGGVIYSQTRVGKNNVDFNLLKFRTMKINSDNHGLLTLGNRDPRITRVGYYLRKTKIDEFPQLINIIKGDMSIVGPRPEVRKYVDMYNDTQKKALSVRPGLTDYASLAYINESEILSTTNEPETVYITKIMPHKIELNLHYIETQNLTEDFKIIFKTIYLLLKRR
jgi:lipopolysaccharide/colanic/teichoic acid biosynthesis glycosyltransferase